MKVLSFSFVLLAIVGVAMAESSWAEVTSMPAEPSGKAVKHGGWLEYDATDGIIFAAKGNKTGDFYAYAPGSDAWTALTPIPQGTEGKLPKRGSRGVWDGDNYVYATKGNNTFGFWRYDIALNSWAQMPDVPEGSSGKGVKGGTDMQYVEIDGAGYVFLLKGYKQDFLRFNIAGDSWEVLTDAPRGQNPKWKKGSWLVHDGSGTLYAHKATYGELWTYDLATASWSSAALEGMPRPSTLTKKKKKSGEGSSAAWYEGAIYALKGGNTCEFWMYIPTTAGWAELEPVPEIGSTGSKKRVKQGGDLVSVGGGVFYALKGKKTREMWQYTVPVVQSASQNGIAGPSGAGLPQGRAVVGVFDLTGRRLATRSMNLGGSAIDGADLGLGSGVYLLRVETGQTAVAGRLVVP